MALTFDATLKELARAYPLGYLTVFDRPTTLPLSLLNVDLSAITKSTDFVVGLGDPLQEILHLDFQASASASKHRDILVYNALLHRLYHVPVHSIIILLRPQAAHSNTNGTVHYAARPNQGKMDFGYQIVRLWEIPAETFLSGDIGTVPLAPLGKLPTGDSDKDELAEVIQRVVDRLIRDTPPDQAKELLTASFLLSGLRIQPELALLLFKGARAMHESATYQYILEEGVTKGIEKGIEKGRQEGEEGAMKRFILRAGRKRFGAPTAEVQSVLDAIHDVEQLQDLADRIFEVSSWQELFAQ